jgi:hypothetical protein
MEDQPDYDCKMFRYNLCGEARRIVLTVQSELLLQGKIRNKGNVIDRIIIEWEQLKKEKREKVNQET